MRRFVFSAIAALFALMPLVFAPARAQEATPAGDSLAGYPKLSVTITADAYLLDADSVAAGWVVLSATNQTDGDAGITALGPKSGMTGDELEVLASTPEPNGDIPAWLLDGVIAGGPSNVAPGATTDALVYLPAGDWAITGEGPQPMARFVTVDSPDGVTTAPTATATIELGDFYFGGLDKGLPSGPQLVKIVASGKQPHMLLMGMGPDTMTIAQLMEVISQPDDATPAPGQLQESDISVVTSVTLISASQTMYLPMNLEAGTYFAVCFVTDPATGAPHAMEGMINVFTVG